MSCPYIYQLDPSLLSSRAQFNQVLSQADFLSFERNRQEWKLHSKLEVVDSLGVDAVNSEAFGVLTSSPSNNLDGDKQYSVIIAAEALNLNRLADLFAHFPESIDCLTIKENRFNLAFSKHVLVVDYIASSKLSNELLLKLSDEFAIDMFPQSSVQLEQTGLALFDMDSTVIQIECIDEIAKLAGLGDKVAEVTERAMRGEIEFKDSLIHRVACLEGVATEKLDTIRRSLPFSPGFSVLASTLQKHGWKIAIASGGFTYFADYIKDIFELDAAYSNTLDESNGVLTGKVNSDIVDAQRKATILNELSSKHQIDNCQTLAIGDGANDLLMMDAAAFGVAYHAKPAVKLEADASIQRSGLEAVLYTLV